MILRMYSLRIAIQLNVSIQGPTNCPNSCDAHMLLFYCCVVLCVELLVTHLLFLYNTPHNYFQLCILYLRAVVSYLLKYPPDLNFIHYKNPHIPLTSTEKKPLTYWGRDKMGTIFQTTSFKFFSVEEIFLFLIKFPNGPIYNNPVLSWIMAWRGSGGKLLSLWKTG